MHSLARCALTSALALNLVACVSNDDGQSGTDAIDVGTKPTASATQPNPPDDAADDAADDSEGDAAADESDDATQEPSDDRDDETSTAGTADDASDDTRADDVSDATGTSETGDDEVSADGDPMSTDDGGSDESTTTTDELPDSFEPGATLQLTLEIAPTAMGPASINPIADAWLINVDVQIGADGATAYLATTGERRNDSTARGTDGSSQGGAFEVVVDGRRLEFEPCSVYAGGMIQFETLNLDFSGASITGDAQGSWEVMGGDYFELVDFTATLVAARDVEAPSTNFTSGGALLPFDAINVNLSEPVRSEDFDVSVSTGETLAADVVPQLDAREGFVTGFSLSRAAGWPPGETIAIRLDHATDAAGNESTNLDVGSVSIQDAPDSMSNLGFEMGDDGWLYVVATEQVELQNYQDSSVAVDPVAPPEGSGMALITQRATGYLWAPDGTTELCFSAGLHSYDLEANAQYGGGFDVELITPAAHSIQSVLASSFEPFANVSAGWSGFGERCVGLPSDAQEGVWLNVTPTGFAPPAAFPPDVLLDALRFQ